LRGAQLITWIQQTFGVELSLLDVFECSTLSSQARLIESRLTKHALGGTPAAEYMYFGHGSTRLFGAMNRATAEPTSEGVVLCYPMGQEYMRIHRTYTELARGLASAGYSVLRFDYFGCGDSEGNFLDATLERWIDDIYLAYKELRSNAVSRIWLVGSRLGANLALEASLSLPDLQGLVLWEPIIDGKTYISTLRRAHEDLLRNNAVLDGYERFPLPPRCCAEFVGYPFSRGLLDQLAAIDLIAGARLPAIPTLVVANTEKRSLCDFAVRTNDERPMPDFVCTGEPDAIWLKEDRQNKGVIPVKAVQNIISWIRSRYA